MVKQFPHCVSACGAKMSRSSKTQCFHPISHAPLIFMTNCNHQSRLQRWRLHLQLKGSLINPDWKVTESLFVVVVGHFSGLILTCRQPLLFSAGLLPITWSLCSCRNGCNIRNTSVDTTVQHSLISTVVSFLFFSSNSARLPRTSV